jgi:flavin-dependent thymidylate synthase
MQSEQEIIDSIDNEEFELTARSRALEFLASLESSPLIKTTIRRYLSHEAYLLRESAAIAAVSHFDFDIFGSLSDRLDSPEELPGVKETIEETLKCWEDEDPVRLQRYQKIRSRVLNGSNTVELVEYSGNDLGHALSAWTSTSRELSDEKRARVPKLLQKLASEGHHTPFEKSYMRFLVKVDMATHIHLLKHRIGVSVNGESARYKELKDDKYYVPFDMPDFEELDLYVEHLEMCLDRYHKALQRYVDKGIARKRAKDMARFYIPYGNQLILDISFNFRSFMHFQGLRNSDHAQKEVCNLAKNMLLALWETGQFNESLLAFGWSEEKIRG